MHQRLFPKRWWKWWNTNGMKWHGENVWCLSSFQAWYTHKRSQTEDNNHRGVERDTWTITSIWWISYFLFISFKKEVKFMIINEPLKHSLQFIVLHQIRSVNGKEGSFKTILNLPFNKITWADELPTIFTTSNVKVVKWCGNTCGICRVTSCSFILISWGKLWDC